MQKSRNSKKSGERRSNNGLAPRRAKRSGLGIKAKDDLSYTNIELLQKCVGSQGQMFSRRRTGLSAQRQRELKKAIKHARHLGLLPFVG
jgi:small subunit ribosomal protein S18